MQLLPHDQPLTNSGMGRMEVGLTGAESVTAASGGATARLFTADLQARSTAGTWDAHNPLWFSGTGCTATGSAVSASGYISHAQLLVNGVVVREYWDDLASDKPSSLPSYAFNSGEQSSQSLSAVFDSTAFPDGSPIAITMKVWDTNGGYYDTGTPLYAPAYNKALILENNTIEGPFGFLAHGSAFDDVFTHLTSDCQSINHTVTHSKQVQKLDLVGDYPPNYGALPQDTVFYIVSHGVDNSFDDCYGTPDSDGTTIVAGDVLLSLHGKLVSSNITNDFQLPPYNFVMLDCCHAADDPSVLGSAFGISGVNPDQGFIGWGDFLLQWNCNANWTERTWDNLASGQTVLQAMINSTADGAPQGFTSDTVGLGNWNPLKIIPLPIAPQFYGDPSMKLHGVYDSIFPDTGLAWHRP